MMQWWPALLRGLVFGNVWIGFCALAFTASGAILYEIQLPNSYYFMVFSGTVGVYSFHRLAGDWLRSEKKVKYSSRHRWLAKNKKAMWLVCLVGCTLAATIGYLSFRPYLLWFFTAGLVCLLYVMPIIVLNGRWIKLREVPYLKLILISSVWILLADLLPWEINHFEPTSGAVLILMARILIIITLILPFDIRDAKVDEQLGVKTLVGLWGADFVWKLTQWLSLGALLLFFGAWILDALPLVSLNAMALSLISFSITLSYRKTSGSDLYYGLVIDGAFIDQWVWLVFFHWLMA